MSGPSTSSRLGEIGNLVALKVFEVSSESSSESVSVSRGSARSAICSICCARCEINALRVVLGAARQRGQFWSLIGFCRVLCAMLTSIERLDSEKTQPRLSSRWSSKALVLGYSPLHSGHIQMVSIRCLLNSCSAHNCRVGNAVSSSVHDENVHMYGLMSANTCILI